MSCHYPTSHNTEYSYHLAVSAVGEKNAVLMQLRGGMMPSRRCTFSLSVSEAFSFNFLFIVPVLSHQSMTLLIDSGNSLIDYTAFQIIMQITLCSDFQK